MGGVAEKRRFPALDDDDPQVYQRLNLEIGKSPSCNPVDRYECRKVKRYCATDCRNDQSSLIVPGLLIEEQLSNFERQNAFVEETHRSFDQLQLSHEERTSYHLDDDELNLLTKDQLFDVLMRLVSQYQQLVPELAKMIPRLTPSLAEKQLLALEKELFDALPRTKDGIDTSSNYAFTRANKQLRALKNKLLKHLDYFVNPSRCRKFTSRQNYLLHSFQFLGVAGDIIQRLPIWQDEANNSEFTIDSYTHLARAWKLTISVIAQSKEYTGIFPINLVSHWFKTLHFYTSLVKGNYGFMEVLRDFINTFSWCPLTLDNPPMHNSILACQHISIDRENLSPNPTSSSRTANMLTSVSG